MIIQVIDIIRLCGYYYKFASHVWFTFPAKNAVQKVITIEV